MIRKAVLAFFLVVVMLAFTVSVAVAQGGEAQIDEVLFQTEEIRGLQASPDIAVNFLSRTELRERMLEDFEEENPGEELRDAQEIMVMLGFIEPGLDLDGLLVDLYSEQVAGFYDPEDDSLYLISEERENMSAMDRYILSHELTHYLQDQNFDLMRPPFHDGEDTVVETDDDSAFAATCLIEGDAVITSDDWLAENVDLTEMMDMQVEAGEYSTEVFDEAPRYIQDSLLFPYQEGRSFVDYIYDEGGFDAVDQAYNDPPQSTEQIYHPQKYIAGEKAIEVELPDVASELGEGWELSYDNVLGEFDVYELFRPYFTGKTTRQVAEGWGGNRYHYYRSDDGGMLLVQGYAWDSEKDAQEFASAYIKYLRSRFEGEIEEENSSDSWMLWSTDDYQLALKKDGTYTYLVQSTGGEPLQTVLSELGGAGDEIMEGAIEEQAEDYSAGERDFTWLVIGVVVGLLVLGLILVVIMLMLTMRKRPPGPPYQPPGGGPGPYYGGPGGYGGTGHSGVPGGWGQVPPPPPPQPPQ